ncbi:MAG: hypothetical protein H0U70_10675 [Tatlockia sp.]|nr:hypothetical protein [Tatlockia sp.]
MIFRFKRLVVLLSCLLPFQVIADKDHFSSHAWSLNASLGYESYSDMYQKDGLTALSRLGIAVKIAEFKNFFLAVEAGIQSGTRMRLKVPFELLDEMGGLPLEITVKPMLDLLLTAQTISSKNLSLSLIAKGGIAYRQQQLFRQSVNNLSQVNAEMQIGFGYKINKYAGLSLLYQHVFGGHPNFRYNSTTEKGHIDNITKEQGVLFGISISA